MIGIVLEQFRKIENSSRTLEHVFAGVKSFVRKMQIENVMDMLDRVGYQ